MSESGEIKLNLGCGKNLLQGFINFDMEYPNNYKEKGQTFIKRDLNRGLPFGYNTVDRIEAVSFLEHLMPNDMIFMMNECWRTLKNGKVLMVKVPYWKSEACWRDPTHIRGYSMETTKYFDQRSIEKYKTYGFMPWNVEEIKMLRNRDDTEDSMIKWVLTPYKEAEWQELNHNF